jgi:hydroxymethylpyrimidine pyrophosphatase-like HAD family hydrolase
VTGERRAIAIDLDGTLLRSDGSIGQRSLRAIREAAERGWPIILSTGRPVRAIRPAVPAWFEGFYWAACNGAWLLQRGQILERIEISAACARYWIDALSDRRLHFFIEAGDRLYSDGEMIDGFVGACCPLDEWAGGDVCKVLVSVRSTEQVEAVRGLMPPECAYVVTDGGGLVQVAHRDCDKLTAAKYVLRREGIGLEQLIAFGDDNNDIALLRGAGCGVAMANATRALRTVADHVTGTNDQDGVAAFLERALFA